MKIYEIAAADITTGFYDPAADKLNRRDISDVRKKALPLKMLNRLKKMRALKKLENLKREDLLGIMYGLPDESSGPSF